MRNRIALTIALAALLPLAAAAQPPSPTQPPPQPAVAGVPPVPATPATPATPPAPPAPEPNDHARGPYTFLGVETSHVPRVVSEQLGLPRGFGLVVDYVVPKSAADTAGLQQNDIIRMLNDQMIVDSSQLGVLVRSFADGTSVNLTILRKGQEMKLPVKLQQKQASSEPRGFGYDFNFEGLEDLKNFHMPDMSAVREAAAQAKQEALRAGDEVRRAARNLRIITSNDGTVKSTHIDLGKAQIVLSDEKGELRLETVNGRKTLTAKDPSGKVLFSGPIETSEERAKIPPEVRQRFENLEHQELPAIPPNEQLEPRTPNPTNSARLQKDGSEQAALVPSPRSGWTRDTIRL